MLSEIPIGWEVRSLAATAELCSTGYWGGDQDGPGLLPARVIRNGDVGEGRIKTDLPTRFFTAKQIERARVAPGDAILVSSGNVGRIARVGESDATPVTVASNFVRLVRAGPLATGEFLGHLLASSIVQQQLATHVAGSAIKNLHGSAYDEVMLPLPPIAEQRKIAAILSSVDETIEKTEAVIAQIEAVKKATSEDLLARGIPGRHSRFRQIENGKVPQDWELRALGDFASVRGGKRMPKGRPFAPHATPHPYIRVSDFDDGTVRMSELRYVLPEDQKDIRAYTISCDDLYISIAGTLGLVGMIPPELDGAQLTENAAKICAIDSGTVHTPYLMFALQASRCQDQLGRLKGVGAGVPKLALFRIASVQVALPPMEEQRLIAAALSSIDERRRRERQSLQNLGRLKGALSAALLSGDLRVVSGEVE